VREFLWECRVASGIDIRVGRAQVLVHIDAIPAEAHLCRLEAQVLDVCFAAGADQVDFADRVAALLDVFDLEVTVRKGLDPELHQLEVAVAPASGLAERRMLEHAVLGEQIGAFGKEPLVEIVVVFANEEMRHGVIEENTAYHATYFS
jgi:hypothetical protein